MALLPQDRRGQTLLMIAVLGGALLYFAACGEPTGTVPGVAQLKVTRDSLQVQIDSVNAVVNAARRDVASGAIQQLEARLAEYRASLDLMRNLVPAGAEVPNLLDDITSRARVRGAEIATFTPAAVESGSPFDVLRARLQVTGRYDQIGEFLSDVASLPRIVVPYDLRIQRIQSPTADTSVTALLQASFQIRTYVKPALIDSTAAGAAPATGGDD